MAKTPRPPKPKLPKKKSLGERVKDEVKKATAKGLEKNFGVLGSAIAKRYIPTSPKVTKRVKEASKPTEKKIPKKEVKKSSLPDEAISESTKIVTTAVDTVVGNATRAFATSTRQAQIMGEDVTSAVGDLNQILERILYQPSVSRQQASMAVPVKPGDAGDIQAGGGGINIPWWLALARRSAPLAVLGVLKGTGLFSGRTGISSSREEMLKEVQKDNETTAGKKASERVESIRKWLHGWFGGNSDASPVDTDGKVKIGGDEHVIHRMKYKAEKITFKASSEIEFRNKHEGGSKVSPTSSGGMFNNFIDTLRGGPGGAGMFNNLADKVFGTGGGNGRGSYGGAGNTDNSGSSGGPSSPAIGTGTGNPGPIPQADKTKTGDYPEGTERLKHASGNLQGMDPKLMDVMKASSKDLPEGWHAEIISGRDPRATGTKNHPAGIAADIKIYDKEGRLIPYDRGGPGMKYYEQFHQSMVERGKVMYPDEKFIWGGTWISKAAGHGDPMHMQRVDPSVPGSSQTSGAYDPNKGAKGHPFEDFLMNDQERKEYQEKIRDKIKSENEGATPVAKSQFGNIPWLGDPSSEEAESGRESWNWMRRSPNIEDRRKDASTTDEQNLDDARIRELEGQGETLRTFVDPSPLGYALGGKDLDMMKKVTPQYEMMQWDDQASKLKMMEPPEPLRRTEQQRDNDIWKGSGRSTSSQQSMDVDDMDHRPRQEAVPSQKFSEYMSTENGLEDYS